MGKLANFALRREPAIIAILFFLGPFVTLLVPKATVGVIVLLFLCCTSLAVARGTSIASLLPMNFTLGLFALTGLYLFLNATWSLDPERAFGKASWFVGVVFMSFYGAHALTAWPKRSLEIAATALLVGVSAGTAIILFEVATDRALTLMIYKALPITAPDSLKRARVVDGEIVRISAAQINHNVAVLLLSLWPALLCLVSRLRGRWGWLSAAGLLLAVLVTIFLSRHESSKVGLVLSLLVFGLAVPWPNLTRKALWLGWCLAFIAAIPLAMALYKANWHEADWLSVSARERVTIWAYTASQIPAAPILGIGATSTRKMDLARKGRPQNGKARRNDGAVTWRAGAHAHNAFLQTWYELGAIGVLLFMVTGSAVILSLRRLTHGAQPYALAHFSAFAAIAAFGWGLWQSWLMALAGLAALTLALAANLARAAKDDQGMSDP